MLDREQIPLFDRHQVPLPTFVQRVLHEAEPLSQNTTADNIGFGWLYYAAVRNLRPNFVVAIGSRRGFTPFCAARALQDNGRGKLLFIDPSYSGDGHPGWGGGGLWNHPPEVASRIGKFGLTGWMEHIKMESADAFPLVKQRIGRPQPGVVIVDGAHTFEHSLEDYELYSSLFSDGVVFFHDSVSNNTEVPRTIAELRSRALPMLTLHLDVGLTLVEIVPTTAVEQAWGYLCSASDRMQSISGYLCPFVRPGDRVFDAYCGLSPLPDLLPHAHIFGFDSDPLIINRLRTEHPEHRWSIVAETSLPYANLPEQTDVLVGLGVSRGHATWDPQEVLNNTIYLTGRYLPRTCFFEAAAEYHNADILDDLRGHLSQRGYRCRFESFDSNLASYPRRKILIAHRINEPES